MADRAADIGDQSYFLQGWRTYRKFLDLNYMCHREVYAALRDVLVAAAPPRFRFLDVACGDAAATVTALAGTDVGSYVGIDISRPALDLARGELAALSCPVTLIEQDFVSALAGWSDPVDVVWIGQSLHHLAPDGKRAAAREVRRVLAPGGLFLIWEPTTLPSEDRAGWIRRLEARGRTSWPALDPDERRTVVEHSRTSDHPESAAWWLSLAEAGGFASARELLEAPPGLCRVYFYAS
jgi:SAM-dependent methyltransferase